MNAKESTAELDMSGQARHERKRAERRQEAALAEYKILAKLLEERWCVSVDERGNWVAHKAAV